jgi:hypothetical protein
VLRALDALLQQAVATQQSRWSGDTLADRFRGLYVSHPEVEQWLQQAPGAPVFSRPSGFLPDLPPTSQLRRLGDLFSLSLFDLSVVAIALAPEIDLRYERLYAFLQDDVTRKRPTVDLALSLLCSSADEKLVGRERFAPDAPMCRHRIIHLLPDREAPQAPLLACGIKLQERVLQFLLGNQSLDARLSPYCCLHSTNGNAARGLGAENEGELSNLRQQVSRDAGAAIVHFWGGSPLQMQEAAQALAAGAGLGLLTADLESVGDDVVQEIIFLVLREATLQQAIPYFKGLEHRSTGPLGAAFRNLDGKVIIATKDAAFPITEHYGRSMRLQFAPLGFQQRRHYWESNLVRHGFTVDGVLLDLLARRYRLAAEQIATAVEDACAQSGGCVTQQSQSAAPSAALSSALFSAARSTSGLPMAKVARKVQAKHSWNDLILPPATIAQLHELCARIVNSEYVLSRWGFERKLSAGKGTSALFVGPSGTGKTTAAEIIANEIQFDLYKIDLAAVVSKYIGETEKNLDRIFAASENASVILFFDEADALFGKRSEVRDSHDRYANIEISYLLQKIEAYEGAAILATNLGQNMDESFLRRFAFNIRFPFPEEDGRRRIWNTIWPQETPMAEDIDFDYLAGRFRLTGGNIQNVALAAAFLAAQDGGVVSLAHVLRAMEREFDKMGKSISSDELMAELRTPENL